MANNWSLVFTLGGTIELPFITCMFSFQDVADPLFAHCRLHADKRTTASRVSISTKILKCFEFVKTVSKYVCYLALKIAQS